MNRKIYIFSLAAAVLLIFSFIPSVATEISRQEDRIEGETIETDEILEESESIKIKVYHIKDDETYTEELKELTKEDAEALWGQMRSIDIEGLSLVEIYEKRLDLMKQYELVSHDLALSDLIDVEKFGDRYETVSGQDFEAAFAPIAFVGGGLGFGLGLPFFLTSGTFLMMLFGFGLTLCFDASIGVLYQLLTFSFVPILFGYLGGFTGLLLLPVIPGFFYSNAVGLGMVAVTVWKQIPSLG
jgi:hypothetical protein